MRKNHIIHGISDEEDLGKLMTTLFKNTLHCKLPTKYTRLGKVNEKYKVSKRVVKITYASLSEKETVTENLRLLKGSDVSYLHFSDDYNEEQRKELKELLSEAKLKMNLKKEMLYFLQ